jgi:hypothetical protein
MRRIKIKYTRGKRANKYKIRKYGRTYNVTLEWTVFKNK